MACALAFGGCADSARDVRTGQLLALTYNVAGLPEGMSASHPAANMPVIGPLLNDYDLVLLQESWQTPEPNPRAPQRTYHEILAAASGHPYKSEPQPAPSNGNPDRPTAIVSDGLNLFSDFPFGPVTRQRWSGCDDSGADCLSLKGFSFARTRLSGGVCVDVYNLHGEAGDSERDRELKAMNTRDLVAFIKVHSAGRAVIVGGDFNMRLGRESDAANLAYLGAETGLSDACVTLDVVDEEEIDKFFFRSSPAVAITPVSCRFATETFVDFDGGPLSDHDPLVVGFTWRATPLTEADCP